MTMLTNIPPSHALGAVAWKGLIILLARLRRLVNRWVAAAIAHRERQARFVALHGLDDRQLKDIGLSGGQIDEVTAAKALIWSQPRRRE
jgi:uncharacterized protein YjiS (DUF1127 family)